MKTTIMLRSVIQNIGSARLWPRKLHSQPNRPSLLHKYLILQARTYSTKIRQISLLKQNNSHQILKLIQDKPSSKKRMRKSKKRMTKSRRIRSKN